MKESVTVGLIGDHNESVTAHRAIPLALKRAGESAGIAIAFEWVPTEEIDSIARVDGYDGLWCIPGSPYRNMDGALLAIRHVRQSGIPFLGTCGGFQHAVVEYARNVLGWANAGHAEVDADSPHMVIAPLECALVEATGPVRLLVGSHIAAAYGREETIEGYHCRFGLNPRFQEELVRGPLRATATDHAGDIRAIELDGHPFFVATLFQPERAALNGEDTPIVNAFVRACAIESNATQSHEDAKAQVR